MTDREILELAAAEALLNSAEVERLSAVHGEPVAWLPYLTDRADGVTGHYAIARKNPAGYREVWNLRHHHWAAFSDEVLTMEEALAILKKLEMPTAPQPSFQLPEVATDPDDSDEVASLWDHGFKRGWNSCLEAVAKTMQGEPVGWRVIEKKTCFVLANGSEIIASLSGPDAEKNAATIAAMLSAAPPPAPVQVPDKSNLHDKLVFVGYTNGFQILYANDSSHGGEGLFFKDTDIDCTIPLYMLKTHYHRLETTSFGEVTLERLRKVQQPITEEQSHEK